MAKPREELQNKLEEFLGSSNVYFQPPESFKLKYPCIIYELSYMRKTIANNGMYIYDAEYSVTIIDKDPDSDLPRRILKWGYCRFNRFYVADNLNHWVFNLFY